MQKLDTKFYENVTAESLLASLDMGNKQLRFFAVITNNFGSYKVTNGKKVLYEGPSSVRGAEVFNEAMDA